MDAMDTAFREALSVYADDPGELTTFLDDDRRSEAREPRENVDPPR